MEAITLAISTFNSLRTDRLLLVRVSTVNIVIGCESHIDESFATSEVFLSNFTVIRRDQSVGGGACFDNTLDVREEPTLQVNEELIWSRLKIHETANIYIASYIYSFYRTPNNLMEPLSYI